MSKAQLNRVLLTGGVGLFLSAFASGQDTPCDPQLEPPEANPYRYELREDRCEGIYVQEVSSTALNIVAFTVGTEAFDPAAGVPVTLAWDAPAALEGAERVRLRAQGVKPRLYYRMDAVRSPDSRVYTWPTDVLRGLGLAEADVGLSARADLPDGETVYLPLYVSQGEASPAPSYVLSVIPDAELDEVWLSLSKQGEEGYLNLISDRALGYGYYPAGRVFSVPLPFGELSGGGLYRLDLAARLADGRTTTRQARFYHGAAE